MFRQLRASKVLESQQKDKEVLAETLETVEPNLNRMHKIPKLSIYEWFPTQAN